MLCKIFASLVKEYAPATIQERYTLDGKVLETIEATARPDNPASVKILKRLGMHKIREVEKYGALRCLFSIPVPSQSSSTLSAILSSS